MDNFTFPIPTGDVETEIRFDYLNAFENVAESSYSFHAHTVYEVYFIESGEMEVCFDDEEVSLCAHAILIIAPHTVHRVKKCSPALKRFNFRFLVDTENKMTSPPYFLYAATESTKAEMFDIIEKIYLHMPYIKQTEEFSRIKNYFAILTSFIIDSLQPAGKRTMKKRTLPAHGKRRMSQHMELDRFFSENYARAITIEYLASELHYSKTHINRLLQRYWGMSFSEKLNQTRLHVAKQYLCESSEPVHKIAERCGYATLRGFEIFFKKQTGLLPKEYRKEHMEITQKGAV